MSFLSLLVFSALASAREYSVNLGVDWTNATAVSGDVGARANARFGLATHLDLGDGFGFETGTDYVFRRVNWTRDDGARVRVDFDYVDVSARFSYAALPPLAIFLGPRLGINVLDAVAVSRPTPSFDPNARAMIALVEVGARVRLPRGFAAEVFFERGLGDFADDLRDVQTFGLRASYFF